MAGKSAVEAGKAFVELFIKDKDFSEGLSKAGKSLRSWGKGVSIFGAAVTAAGASVVAPLLEMTREFANAGSALNDMSARTGLTVESLSELQFAAEQSGATLEDVEKSLRFMAKNGENVKNFDKLAEKIAAIEDPTRRAEAAIKHFGKGGTAILPMIADLQKLRQEARDAGIVMSGDSAKRADALGDAFDKLTAIIKAVRNVIGDALSETVRGAIGSITEIAIRVGKWVSANRELFVSALKIGTVIMGIGTVISALGVGMIVVGSAISAFNTLLGVAAGLLGALVSPIGLVVAGVIGLATWFATSTTWGRQMVQSLIGWFGDLLQTGKETFGGIADAIAAGDLALAAKVAMAGVKLAWLEGTNWLRTKWSEFKDFYIRTTTEAVFEALRWWIKLKTEAISLWTGMETRSRTIGENIGHWLTRSTDPEVARGQDEAHNMALQNIKNEGITRQRENENAKANELAAIDANAKAAADARGAVYNADVEARKKALADAKAELAALREKAGVERKDRELNASPKFEVGKGISSDLIQQKVFGSFSAAALTAGGSGMSAPDAATVKELREQKYLHIRALQHLDEIRRQGLMT